MVLVGSCRNSEDESRVAALRQLATEAEVSDNVEFKVNVSFDQLKREFSSATMGLHTMWNEHFGIGLCFIVKKHRLLIFVGLSRISTNRTLFSVGLTHAF